MNEVAAKEWLTKAWHHEARKEDRGYLHAYALRFGFGGESFALVLPPDEGERFMREVMLEWLREWHEPWKRF